MPNENIIGISQECPFDAAVPEGGNTASNYKPEKGLHAPQTGNAYARVQIFCAKGLDAGYSLGVQSISDICALGVDGATLLR